MRDGGPVGTQPQLSMTPLPAAGNEIEVQPVAAGVSPGSPAELPPVHESIIAHTCAINKAHSSGGLKPVPTLGEDCLGP